MSLLWGTGGGQIQDPRGVTLNGKPHEERDGQDVALTTDICWAGYNLPKKKENYCRPFGLLLPLNLRSGKKRAKVFRTWLCVAYMYSHVSRNRR